MAAVMQQLLHHYPQHPNAAYATAASISRMTEQPEHYPGLRLRVGFARRYGGADFDPVLTFRDRGRVLFAAAHTMRPNAIFSRDLSFVILGLATI
jgi:hypothetical protein